MMLKLVAHVFRTFLFFCSLSGTPSFSLNMCSVVKFKKNVILLIIVTHFSILRHFYV